jgi:Holliday junction resolvase RusA-like endonuclease
MSAPVFISVFGTPAPQGSKRAFAVRGKGGAPTGRVAVIESSHDRVKSWRQAVIDAANDDPPFGTFAQVPGTPLAVEMVFFLARPASHYGTGRNAGVVKASAPRFPGRTPDLSKLVRATEDALTDCGAWADDAQVVTLEAAKRWADGRPPGARIAITDAVLMPVRIPVLTHGRKEVTS